MNDLNKFFFVHSFNRENRYYIERNLWICVDCGFFNFLLTLKKKIKLEVKQKKNRQSNSTKKNPLESLQYGNIPVILNNNQIFVEWFSWSKRKIYTEYHQLVIVWYLKNDNKTGKNLNDKTHWIQFFFNKFVRLFRLMFSVFIFFLRCISCAFVIQWPDIEIMTHRFQRFI